MGDACPADTVPATSCWDSLEVPRKKGEYLQMALLLDFLRYHCGK